MASDDFSWCNWRVWQHVINDNVVLGLCPCCPRKTQPTCTERIGLLLLFLVTGLFVEHLCDLLGPICRTAYEGSCPAPYFNQTAEALDVGHYFSLLERRLGTVQAVEGEGLHLQSDASIGDFTLVAQNVNDQFFAYFVDHVLQNVSFNCSTPMCDVFAPQEVSYLEAARFYHMDVYRAGALYVRYIPGYCRCSRTLHQAISYVSAQKLLLALTLQTLLPVFFRYWLSKEWEQPKAGFIASLKRKMDLLVKGLLAMLILVELIVLRLIRVDPIALQCSLAWSAIQIVTAQPLKSYLLLILLHRCGCSCFDDGREVDPSYMIVDGKDDDDVEEGARADEDNLGLNLSCCLRPDAK